MYGHGTEVCAVEYNLAGFSIPPRRMMSSTMQPFLLVGSFLIGP